MTSRTLPSPRQAKMICALAAATVLLCGGLFIAAAAAPAPIAVLPLAAAVCIGYPLLVAWNVPTSVAVLRAVGAYRRERSRPALDKRALAELRRGLDALPETEHPLGD